MDWFLVDTVDIMPMMSDVANVEDRPQVTCMCELSDYRAIFSNILSPRREVRFSKIQGLSLSPIFSFVKGG